MVGGGGITDAFREEGAEGASQLVVVGDAGGLALRKHGVAPCFAAPVEVGVESIKGVVEHGRGREHGPIDNGDFERDNGFLHCPEARPPGVVAVSNDRGEHVV